ncbi:hypothetical protein [Streptomyces sp. NPDC015130]|uniref:hypothetical protein n=1 Tax=Streptomyces sp. NPDC015130 TaxID=3364940 RepID=UPI0036FE6B02
MTQPSYPPAQCGTTCTEQHTYRLDECALCTANLHGGYASPAWTVPCPRCCTLADRPCLRRDGAAASVDCQERWTAHNEQQNTQPEPAQIRHTVDTLRNLADRAEHHGGLTGQEATALRNGINDLTIRVWDAKSARDAWAAKADKQQQRAERAEAALDAVRAFAEDIDTPTWRAPGTEVAARLRVALDAHTNLKDQT